MDKDANWLKLKDEGVVVIDFLNKDKLNVFNDDIKKYLSNMPEYKDDATDYVLGGFGALGNPSSFHNPTVRLLRLMAYWKTSEIFNSTNNSGYKYEMIPDRLLFRKAGLTPSRETWHRDLSPLAEADDIIYGGWINLNKTANQHFSYIPQSHLKNSIGGGFSRLTNNKQDLNRLRKVITIGPGQKLIFNQSIIHEVRSTRLNFDMIRLFTAYRLTKSNNSLIPDIANKLVNQEPIPLKSGQQSPMYAKLHLVNHQQKLIDFSTKNIKPSLLEQKKLSRHGIVKVVPRFMKGLQSLDIKKYQEYDSNELNLYTPHSLF